MTEPEDDQTRRVSPPSTPAPVWPSNPDRRDTAAHQRRFAVTAAQMAAEYPSFDAGDGDLPKISFLVRHRFAVMVTALAVVFLLLASGTLWAGFTAGAASASAAAQALADTGRPAPGIPPAATALRTCTASAVAADPALATLHAQVSRADTGEVLFSRAPDDALRAGSSFAALTAAAAVATLGADYQLTTSVVDNSTPGSIVLVGGGDATLSRLPDGQDSVYAGAATIQALAAATLTAYQASHPDVPITEVVLDSSYWDPADRWNSAWNRDLQTGGYLSEVTALQVDGDRDDPTQQVSPRSTDPAGRAGDAFVTALGLDPDSVTVRVGGAENGAPVLAEVTSQPLSTLVEQMLRQNDATLAEMLARVVSVESKFSGSAASLQQAIPQALQGLGLDTADITVTDGSGLSRDDSVSASFLAALMTTAASDTTLATVLTALSSAGESGVLSDRFTDANASAAGAVVAVSGSLDGVRSLAGVVTAADGTVLSFAFVASGGAVADGTETALDTLAATVQTCGNNLSNL